MTSIYGYTELMLTREMKPEQVRSLVQRVHTQSQVMMSILNELLDLSRIEAEAGSDFNWQCVDLQQEVSLVVPSFSPPHQREPVVVVPIDRPCRSGWIVSNSARCCSTCCPTPTNTRRAVEV